MTRRMLDSGIWANEHFAELPPMARLLQIGIINHADDQGRMKAHPLYLRSQIFPYDDITTEDIERWLSLIANNETVILYEIDGKAYLQLANWWEYQSPSFASPSEYPRRNGWQDRVRYTGKGRTIYTCNWVAANGDALPNTCDMDGKPIPPANKRKTPTEPPPPPTQPGHEEQAPNHDHPSHAQPYGQPPERPYGQPPEPLNENKNKHKNKHENKQQHARATIPESAPTANAAVVQNERTNGAGFESDDLPPQFDRTIAHTLFEQTFPTCPSIPDRDHPTVSLTQHLNQFYERAGSDEMVSTVFEIVHENQRKGTRVKAPLRYINTILGSVLEDQEANHVTHQRRTSNSNGRSRTEAPGTRSRSGIGDLPEKEANRIRELLARNHTGPAPATAH